MYKSQIFLSISLAGKGPLNEAFWKSYHKLAPTTFGAFTKF
jgi:hypothetical protein